MASTKLGMHLTTTAAPELFKIRLPLISGIIPPSHDHGHITKGSRLLSKELTLGNMRSTGRICSVFMIYV